MLVSHYLVERIVLAAGESVMPVSSCNTDPLAKDWYSCSAPAVCTTHDGWLESVKRDKHLLGAQFFSSPNLHLAVNVTTGSRWAISGFSPVPSSARPIGGMKISLDTTFSVPKHMTNLAANAKRVSLPPKAAMMAFTSLFVYNENKYPVKVTAEQLVALLNFHLLARKPSIARMGLIRKPAAYPDPLLPTLVGQLGEVWDYILSVK